ncbi:MAG: hypothetical protein KC502_23595, partial [Myxococcales bacterium]|nr:hypothetical protein [Myxococcales bacterium]
MDRVDTSEATNEPESGGNPGIWRLVALIALVLVGSVGWVILGAMDRQEAEQLVADAHAALDSGDTTTAATNVAKAEKKDPGRGDLVFAKGRLALAMDDQPLAQRLLRQSHERAKNEGWTLLMRAKLAVALAESEANSGDLVRALRVNDSGLARLVDVMDTHLDRDGLDPNAQPTDTEPMAQGVREGLILLRQRGRLAAQRAKA